MTCCLAVKALPDSWTCCCSKFYAIVKGKPSKFENESSIPMEAIHSTHKVHLQPAWHANMLLQTVPCKQHSKTLGGPFAAVHPGCLWLAVKWHS